MNSIQRVLVTGGAGMIGSRIVRDLVDRGIEVAVIDNLSSGMRMPDNVARAVFGDIRNVDLVGQIFRSFRPDTVFHLAAVHHIPTCERQRAYSLDVNVTGTENVLQAAEATEVERVVIASSGAVYAWDETALVEDRAPQWACDNYAIAKTCNESQLRFWSERTGRTSRAARIFNTLGHDDPNAHLLPEIISQLRNGGNECTIQLGNINSRRDYIHASDVASGLWALACDNRSDVSYDVFNIASGTEYSVAELVAILAQLLNRNINIQIDESRKRKIDRPSQLGSTEKSSRLLNWSASMSFDSALQSVLEKYK